MKKLVALVLALVLALMAVDALAVEEWYYQKCVQMIRDYIDGKLSMTDDKVEQYVTAIREFESAHPSITASNLANFTVTSTETSTSDAAQTEEEKVDYVPPVKQALISEVIEDSEQTKELLEAFKEALEAGDVLTVLPEELRDQLPEEYSTINEVITIMLSGNVDDIVSATVNFSFVTQYKAGETVYLAFAISPTQWVLKEGYVQEDGSVNVKLDRELIERILDKAVTLVVINK